MQGYLIFHTLHACGDQRGIYVQVLRARPAKPAHKYENRLAKPAIIEGVVLRKLSPAAK